MSKRPNLVPSQPLNTVIPLPVYTALCSHLYSELEGRVPHGAFSRFLTELLRKFFSERHLDLAPYLGCAPGALQVSGSPEAILELQQRLKESA